jgi:hypothetical protein
MLTSAAIGAGDRWPVGCALLIALLLSLLLWAMLWILLWRLFGSESVANFRGKVKRRLVIRMVLGDPPGRGWIAAVGFSGLHRTR